MIYRSNLNNTDTLIVDYKHIDYSGDNIMGGPSANYYEFQNIALHFSKDKDSIHPNKMWFHDWKIAFNVSVDPECPNQFLMWKRYLRFDLDDIQTVDIVNINGIEYDDVYVLERPEEFLDSSTLVWKIYFNYESGILKYENIDNEVFEFLNKL